MWAKFDRKIRKKCSFLWPKLCMTWRTAKIFTCYTSSHQVRERTSPSCTGMKQSWQLARNQSLWDRDAGKWQGVRSSCKRKTDRLRTVGFSRIVYTMCQLQTNGSMPQNCLKVRLSGKKIVGSTFKLPARESYWQLHSTTALLFSIQFAAGRMHMEYMYCRTSASVNQIARRRPAPAVRWRSASGARRKQEDHGVLDSWKYPESRGTSADHRQTAFLYHYVVLLEG